MRRGDAQRTGRVRARCGGDHARCERCGRAAARAAGRAVEGPGIAHLVGRPARSELVRVQVAEQHHPSGLEPDPRLARTPRHVVEQATGRRERLPRNRIEVLEPDGNATKRRRVAGCEPRIRPVGCGERVVLVHAHPGVDRPRVTLVAVRSVPLANPREAGLDELTRRSVPPREERDRFDDAGIGRARHRRAAPGAPSTGTARRPHRPNANRARA